MAGGGSAFSKVLVANRGEIAVRILRTARDMGYATVAVFSEADRDAVHVRAADEAVCIGPPPAVESYLRIDRIVDAARRAGADAVHPGYGFLSENAEFAERCEEAGIRFVGPPPAAIRAMGDKARAKRMMAEAGVPVIPGYHGGEQDDAALIREANRIGFPLLVKAAAGGGGRGMRSATDPCELPSLLASARVEARNAFGSGDLLIEKRIDRARHVEVQVFADARGNAVHLGERDCSAQRRHQKIVEEAPSPAVDPDLRERIGAAAVAAARAAGYVGAGTVEFLLGPDGEFWFMEMNTRLQVEHPVTEMATGLDLVAWQFDVAAGEPLPLRQEDVVLRGHAIEARLYAEDPYEGFLPQSGRVLLWRPWSAAGVRIDSGIAEGQDVPSHYDPLLAKIVAHGPDREGARRRLLRAVERSVLLGLVTNRGFLAALLRDPEFVAGRMTTDYVDGLLARGEIRRPDPTAPAWAVAAVLRSVPPSSTPDPWRNAGDASWPVTLEGPGGARELRVTSRGNGRWVVEGAGAEPVAVAVGAVVGGEVRCEVDGVCRTVRFAADAERLHLHLDGADAAFAEPRPAAPSARDGAADGRVAAPIGGQVLAVPVREGERVARGQCVAVIEAMKMEHGVAAPRDGVVRRIAVSPGDQVAARQALMVVEQVR